MNNVVSGVVTPDPTVSLASIPDTNLSCFLLFVAGMQEEEPRSQFASLVQAAEGLRSDKDAGGGSSASGSTSVVSEGATARVLSFAAEYGALTQSVSGQVVTLRGNLAGLPSALAKHEVFPYCIGGARENDFCVQGSLLSILRRVSFGVSFDASRRDQVVATATTTGNSGAGSTEPVVFSAGGSTLSGVSVRIDFWNQRDVTSSAFQAEWARRVGGAMQAASTKLGSSAGDLAVQIGDLPGYSSWRTTTLARIRAAGRDEEQLLTIWAQSALDLAELAEAGISDFESRLDAALMSYRQYWLTADQLADTLSTKSILALEFRGDRPVGQPRTTNVRLIFDKPLGPQTRLIANGGLTFYNRVPDGLDVSRYRDLQIGAQLDQGLGASSILGRATFSLAGYVQYQNAPSILTVNPDEPIPGVRFRSLPNGASTVLTEKGTLWLAQAKLVLAASDSGISVPVALSYSNRTELIDKSAWRAQVGLTYDFDSVFAALGQ